MANLVQLKKFHKSYLKKMLFTEKTGHVLDILYPECKDNGSQFFKKGDIISDNKGNIVIIDSYCVINNVLYYTFLPIKIIDVLSTISKISIDTLVYAVIQKATINTDKLINCKNNNFTLLVKSNDKLSFFVYYCSEDYMPVNNTDIVNNIYPKYFEKAYLKLNAILKTAPYVFVNTDNKYLIDMNIEKQQLVFSDNIKFAPIYTLSEMRAIISYKKYPYFNSLLKQQKLSILDVKKQIFVV